VGGIAHEDFPHAAARPSQARAATWASRGTTQERAAQRLDGKNGVVGWQRTGQDQLSLLDWRIERGWL